MVQARAAGRPLARVHQDRARAAADAALPIERRATAPGGQAAAALDRAAARRTDGLPPPPQSKTADVFFLAAASPTPRPPGRAGLTELRALAEQGVTVDIPDAPLPRPEFYQPLRRRPPGLVAGGAGLGLLPPLRGAGLRRRRR